MLLLLLNFLLLSNFLVGKHNRVTSFFEKSGDFHASEVLLLLSKFLVGDYNRVTGC